MRILQYAVNATIVGDEGVRIVAQRVKKWRSPLKVSDADKMKREVEGELRWPIGKGKGNGKKRKEIQVLHHDC